jgi:hypothetical protein
MNGARQGAGRIESIGPISGLGWLRAREAAWALTSMWGPSPVTTPRDPPTWSSGSPASRACRSPTAGSPRTSSGSRCCPGARAWAAGSGTGWPSRWTGTSPAGRPASPTSQLGRVRRHAAAGGPRRAPGAGGSGDGVGRLAGRPRLPGRHRAGRRLPLPAAADPGAVAALPLRVRGPHPGRHRRGDPDRLQRGPARPAPAAADPPPPGRPGGRVRRRPPPGADRRRRAAVLLRLAERSVRHRVPMRLDF